RCDQIEEELSKVFANKHTGSRETRLNMDVWRALEKAIAGNGSINHDRVFDFTSQYMTFGRAKELLLQLLESHWLRAESTPEGMFYAFGENAQRSEVKGNGAAT